MRVLLTNHFPLRSMSGVGTLELAKGLLRAGHQVQALVVDSMRTGDERFPVSRLVCRENDPSADLQFDIPCFAAERCSGLTFEDLSDTQLADYRDTSRRLLDQLVEEFDPQVIHAQQIWLQGHLALESGVPYVLSAEGAELLTSRNSARYRPLAQQAAENAGRIITPSEFLHGEVIATFDDVAARTETVPSGIESERFEKASADRKASLARFGLPADFPAVVACVGQLIPEQGIDTLLNAAAIYEQSDRPLATVIAGTGPLAAELAALAQRLKLARVFFVGERSPEDLRALVRLADLLVVPARAELTSSVALEALASATPVIATQTGGLPELVGPATGGLVAVDDHELLAEMILRAFQEEWKQSKGPAAAAFVRETRPASRWIEQIVKIYEQVLAARFG